MIIPIPIDRKEEPEPPVTFERADHAYVKWFMNVPSWKCVCGLTNHGRNERCADWRCRRMREK